MGPAIDIRNLSKCYKLYPRPRARLEEWLSLGRLIRHTEFWALRDFNLRVNPGECVGIIGPNGAGKSTLLKLLSNTLSPSSGSFSLTGKVLSLLELGTGFNAELTGRQNVIETSSLLGFPADYVRQRMDDIAAFSGLGEFLDLPLKTYSSGMTVRLAFSMFVFLKPDVFIIDEALAVGDIGFQRACYRRIEQMLAAGVTCLLVTHDLQAVVRFCGRAVVMDHGRKIFEGDPREAVNCLNQLLIGTDQTCAAAESNGDGAASITDIWFENTAGDSIESARFGESVCFCYAVRFHSGQLEIDAGFHIKTVHGIEVTSASSERLGNRFGPFHAGETAILRWTLDLNLNPNTYFFGCGVRYHQTTRFLARRADAVQFHITDVPLVGGIINPIKSAKCKVQNEDDGAL
jgi:ABC-type polysaccharide/polyol phosphate transport system ATPase subunit